MKIRVVKNDFSSDFIERIIKLDRANMQGILAEAGIEFPEEKRRAGFKKNTVFIVAEKADEIIGYLEYTRSWTDAENIYISSIQIDKNYRRSKTLLQLIDEFIETVRSEDFRRFETSVQKNNLRAVKIYRKIGFEFEENPRQSGSWILKADRNILDESAINNLLEKWRKRKG